MGLPSKKQLHKHKRGTRKALDTLEAMDLTEDAVENGSDVVEKLIEKKKGKSGKAKTPAEAKSKKTRKTKETKAKSKKSKSDAVQKSEKQKRQTTVKEEPVSEEVAIKGNSIEMDPLKKDIDIALGEAPLNLQEDKPSIEKTDVLVSPSKNHSESAQKKPEVSDSGQTENADDVALITDGDQNEDTQKDKFLTFRIGDESYGIAISHVTEIIVMQRITEVPDTPVFVRGVINLRGQVIPVIDIRERFHMEFREYDERTCIIVVECNETSVGMIVDTVNEVVDIPEDQIDPPPRSHAGLDSSYIEGMGKTDNRVNIILNIEKVLFVQELLARQNDLIE